MDALNLAYLLSPTLTYSHSPILEKARRFPPHPVLSWGSQCPSGSQQEEREIRVGLAHTPSPSGPQAASSCWEHLHLPGLLQHFQPLCLLKLGLCRQQDVPLPGRGATVFLRGHLRTWRSPAGLRGSALSLHIPMALTPLPGQATGGVTPRDPRRGEGRWVAGESPREAALPLLSPA